MRSKQHSKAYRSGVIRLLAMCCLIPMISIASADMANDIRLYNNAILDQDETGTAYVYRFNITATTTYRKCDDCLSYKIIGIPNYSVFVNNAFVSSFDIRLLGTEQAVTEEHALTWLNESLTNVRAYKVIDLNQKVKRVFVLTDRFIEQHFRVTLDSESVIEERRAILSNLEALSPQVFDVVTFVQQSIQQRCFDSLEIRDTFYDEPMVAFLSGLFSMLSDSEVEFKSQVQQVVSKSIDCGDHAGWVDRVTKRLKHDKNLRPSGQLTIME